MNTRLITMLSASIQKMVIQKTATPSTAAQSKARQPAAIPATALLATSARVLALCLGLLVLAGCNVTRPLMTFDEDPLAPYPGTDLSEDAVDEQIQIGRDELAQGLVWEAARRSLRLFEETRLDSDRGNATMQLMVEAFDAGIANATKPSQLDRFRSNRLPRTVRAMRTIGKARLLLDRGSPQLAFEEVVELERTFPSHHLAREAADLVHEAATQLRERDSSFWIFWSDVGRADIAYNYLVIQDPTHPRCDEAYWRMAQFDVRKRRYADSIESLADLVLFYPNSPYAIDAEAQIPRLRLADQARIDFDIGSLDRSLAEIRSWLDRHGRSGIDEGRDALIAEMRDLEVESLRRLARSDLVVARYYDTLHESFGAHQHAARALDYARQAGLQDEIASAQALVEEHLAGAGEVRP